MENPGQLSVEINTLAYLALKTVLFPAVWISGLAYLGYALWDDADTTGWVFWAVANIHLLAAFAIASFVIVHVYLLTIGHGFREHLRPMITGYERVVLTPEQEAYLRQEDPSMVKTDA